MVSTIYEFEAFHFGIDVEDFMMFCEDFCWSNIKILSTGGQST